MKRYESIFILDNNAEKDSIVDALVKKLEGFKVEILKVDRWGKKRLAYEIGKRQYGDYTCIEFNADPKVIDSLEREFRLNEELLRFITYVVSKNQMKQRELDKKVEAPTTSR